MAKHSTKSKPTQDLHVAHTAHVELPLPMLSALEDIDRAFFGVCIEAGKQVLGAMMEHDRTALCGLPWKPDEERPGRRAGSTESPVTLGGRRIAIRRPRVRSIYGEELGLPSFEAATDRDPLDRHTLGVVAAGVSTRRYTRSLDRLPPTETERSTSKSAVSRRFVALSEQKLGEWLSQPLDALDLKVVMLDGIHFRDHCILVALGVDSAGQKHPLGIREGNTENAAVAKALLADLLALIQRCPVHKRRNVLGHLPQSARPSIKRALDEAWNAADATRAQRLLENLARSLEPSHPGAAASLREGLEETLTLLRLGVRGILLESLRSTNAIESLNDQITSYTRRVKRWQGGKMMLRWVGAAILDARKGFRGVRGLKEMSTLVNALRRHEKSLHVDNEAA
jgi:transposase-like protein